MVYKEHRLEIDIKDYIAYSARLPGTGYQNIKSQFKKAIETNIRPILAEEVKQPLSGQASSAEPIRLPLTVSGSGRITRKIKS